MPGEQPLDQLLTRFRGFAPPSSPAELSALHDAFPDLPPDITHLFQRGLASPHLPTSDAGPLAARLMPITECLATAAALPAPLTRPLGLGPIAWLWTDDNSNYVGVYTTGPLRAWVTKLNHDEPELTPAYRSVASFLEHLLSSGPGAARDAIDIPSIPRQLPLRTADPALEASDRRLLQELRAAANAIDDDDARRALRLCALVLTPVPDTVSLIPMLRDDDLRLPAAAVELFAYRGFQGGVAELERLARTGTPNGDAAAIQQLARLNTPQSRKMLDQLATTLSGAKLQSLKFWTRPGTRFLPPTWP